MLDPNKVITGEKDGEVIPPTPEPTDIYAQLRGQKDESGIPLHPEEKADYYKTKFSESTSGVEKLLGENKSLKEQNQTLQTKKTEELSDDELSKDIPDWDILTIAQKRAITNQVGTLKKDLESIKIQVAEIVDEREFENAFKKVTSEPKFEIIKKHKTEFKEYAYQTENLNVPLTMLAKLFLVDKQLTSENIPPVVPKDPNPDAGLKGLDDGSGGDRTPPKQNGYSVEEIEKIRKEDPRKYNRLAKEKKLNIRNA